MTYCRKEIQELLEKAINREGKFSRSYSAFYLPKKNAELQMGTTCNQLQPLTKHSGG